MWVLGSLVAAVTSSAFRHGAFFSSGLASACVTGWASTVHKHPCAIQASAYPSTAAGPDEDHLAGSSCAAELHPGAEDMADASPSGQAAQGKRSSFFTAPASIPSLSHAASTAKGLLSVAAWPAAFLLFIWMFWGVLAWLSAAGAGLLVRWCVSVATRRAIQRIMKDRTSLRQAPANAGIRLLSMAAPTTTAVVVSAYEVIRRAAHAARTAAAPPTGSGSERRKSYIGAAAAFAWRACAFMAAAGLHACLHAFGAARIVAGTAVGMGLWCASTGWSALSWAGGAMLRPKAPKA